MTRYSPIIFAITSICGCMGHLNFIILTVGDYPTIGPRIMLPAFYVALEKMATKYPGLYANYTVQHVGTALITDESNLEVCSPSGYGAVVVNFTQVYHRGSFSFAEGVPVILTPSMSYPCMVWVLNLIHYLRGMACVSAQLMSLE